MIIRLVEPISYRYAGYECAAWWKEMDSDTGEFELQFPEKQDGEPHYTVTFPATVTRDNFQSLFCGNRIGKPYDETQNAGQRAEFRKLFPVDGFVTDPRFIVTRENIDEVCDLAMAVLRGQYAKYRNWLLRELTKHETFDAPQTGYDLATPTKLMTETLERLREVETFRKWHRNTWGYQDQGRGFDYVWHGYRKAEAAK